MSSFCHGRSDEDLRECKQQFMEEFLTNVIDLEKEVAIKRSQSDDRKICKIRDLGNELVILEFEDTGQEKGDGGKKDVKNLERGMEEGKNLDELIHESRNPDLDAASRRSDKLLNGEVRSVGVKPSDECPGKRAPLSRLISYDECSEVFTSRQSLEESRVGKPLECQMSEAKHTCVGGDHHILGCTDIGLDLDKTDAVDLDNADGVDAETMRGENFRLGSSCKSEIRSHLDTSAECSQDDKRKRKVSEIDMKCGGHVEKEFQKKGGTGKRDMSLEVFEMYGREREEEHEEEEKVGVKETFSCDACHKYYPNRRGLNRHLRVHKGEKPYMCLICERRFSYKHDLHNHVKVHTNSLPEIHKLTEYVDKPFTCGTCGRQFPFEFDFQRHLKVHLKVDGGRNSTLQEGKTLKNTISIVTNPTHKDGPLVNSYSSKLRSGGKNLQDRKYKADCGIYALCIERGLNKQDHASHLMTQNADKPFRCCVCQKGFSYRRCLQKHVVNHSNILSGSESISRSKLLSGSDSVSHSEHLSGTDTAIHTANECLECNMKFPLNFDLQKHMQIHKVTSKMQRKVGEKPYKCQTCCKKFAFKKALARHTVKHGTVSSELHSCSVCKKSFVEKKKYNLHMRYHMRERTSEETANCLVCGKYFAYVQSLELHKRRHGKEQKAFECNLCRKRFINASELRKHDDSHTKPFPCGVCGRRFADERKRDACKHARGNYFMESHDCKLSSKIFLRFAEYGQHMLHHLEGSYQCVQCQKNFQEKQELDKHILICTKLQAVDSILSNLM